MRMVVQMVDQSVPFSFNKRGFFYFTRRIPSDLKYHYRTARVTYSLRTKSPRLATKRALIAAAQLDEYWDKLRDSSDQIPSQHFAASDQTKQMNPVPDQLDSGPLMSEATDIYLRLKGHNRPKTFATSTQRACVYLFATCEDKYLGEYSKKDATSFRDTLFDRGMNGASVGRVIGTIKSIYNFAINENGLDFKNPFANGGLER